MIDRIETYAAIVAIGLLYALCCILWLLGFTMLFGGLGLFFYGIYDLLSIITARTIPDAVNHLWGIPAMLVGGGVACAMTFTCIDGIRSLPPRKFFSEMLRPY